jgi:signal transduction histidine kinase/CheY-like chemotaxis protein
LEKHDVKVKNKLEIIAILPIITAVAVTMILFKISDTVKEVDSTARVADSTVRQISEVNLATCNYLVSHGDSYKRQWHLKHAQLMQQLAAEKAKKLDDKGILQDISNRLGGLRETFIEIVRNHEQNVRQARNSQTDSTAREEELTRRFWVQSQCIVEGALALSEKAHAKAAHIQDKARMLIAGTCAVLAVMLLVIALTLSSAISKGILALYDGMQAVARGSLDRDVTVRSRDELGQLASVFNKMRTQLKGWRSALENECEEHKKTASSLRESSRHLSDALIKLKRAQQQSIEQERMQALKQMAGGIVHDFNNSLTPIIGTTEYLLSTPEALKDPAELKDSLELIDEASKAARNIVKNLTEFFRPTTADTNDFISVNDIVQNAISLTRPRWKEQSETEGATINVVTDLAKEAPAIHGDKIEMEEAVTNLILNAVDAMPTGGTMTFKTRVERNMSTIEISDNGEGMTHEVKARCFEPFFSTKGPMSSGMGLSVTKAIIARHKGTMELDSEPSKGTTVTIRLPRQLTPPHKEAFIAAARPVAGLRVLVVDDDSWSRKVIQKHLAADGCVVECVADGHDALAKMQSASFNIVMLDRAMPDMSGDQLAADVKKIAPAMPVIMLTGFAGLMEEHGEHPKYVDVVVGKPFTRNEIRAALAKATKIRRA